MLVRKAVAAASITLMTAGLGLATAAPASAAPTLINQIAQDLRGDLPLLRDVDLVIIDLGGGRLINIDVDELTVVELNNVVIEILNDLDINIQDINIDVDITDNVVIIDVL